MPTALEFRNALKIITVPQLLKTSKSGSCDDDGSDYLADFLPSAATQNYCISDFCIKNIVWKLFLLRAEWRVINQACNKYIYIYAYITNTLTTSAPLSRGEYYLAGYCMTILSKTRPVSYASVKWENLQRILQSSIALLTKLKEVLGGLTSAELVIRSIEPMILTML